MKPPKCCHPDCENCPYVDCKWDGYSSHDDEVTKSLEKELELDAMPYEQRHRKEIADRYRHSEKGQRTARAYRQTENYAESQKRYWKTEQAKRLGRERYHKKSKEVGRPYSTVRDNMRKHGIDMGKGEFIRTISTNGRVSIPKRFLEQLGLGDGSDIAIYVDGHGKIVIVSADKAREISRKRA